jgi:hypothetical protein
MSKEALKMEKILELQLHSSGELIAIKSDGGSELGNEMESGATTIRIDLPENVYGGKHYLEFVKPSGTALSSSALDEKTDASATHYIELAVGANLTNESGRYAMQYVAKTNDATPKTIKSKIAYLDVEASINAAVSVSESDPDFIAWATKQIAELIAKVGGLDSDESDDPATKEELEAEASRAGKAESDEAKRAEDSEAAIGNEIGPSDLSIRPTTFGVLGDSSLTRFHPYSFNSAEYIGNMALNYVPGLGIRIVSGPLDRVSLAHAEAEDGLLRLVLYYPQKCAHSGQGGVVGTGARFRSTECGARIFRRNMAESVLNPNIGKSSFQISAKEPYFSSLMIPVAKADLVADGDGFFHVEKTLTIKQIIGIMLPNLHLTDVDPLASASAADVSKAINVYAMRNRLVAGMAAPRRSSVYDGGNSSMVAQPSRFGVWISGVTVAVSGVAQKLSKNLHWDDPTGTGIFYREAGYRYRLVFGYSNSFTNAATLKETVVEGCPFLVAGSGSLKSTGAGPYVFMPTKINRRRGLSCGFGFAILKSDFATRMDGSMFVRKFPQSPQKLSMRVNIVRTGGSSDSDAFGTISKAVVVTARLSKPR